MYEGKRLIIPVSLLFIGPWREFYCLGNTQLKDVFTLGMAEGVPCSDCLWVRGCRTKLNAGLAKYLEGHGTICHRKRRIRMDHICCLEFVLKSQWQDHIPPTGTFKQMSLDGHDSILTKSYL